MAKYTEEKIISFGDTQDSRLLIVSGGVTVSAWDGEGWVIADSFETGSYEYFTRNAQLKITPNIDASFYIDEVGK